MKLYMKFLQKLASFKRSLSTTYLNTLNPQLQEGNTHIKDLEINLPLIRYTYSTRQACIIVFMKQNPCRNFELKKLCQFETLYIT